jgi:hypothetical protein
MILGFISGGFEGRAVHLAKCLYEPRLAAVVTIGNALYSVPVSLHVEQQPSLCVAWLHLF